MLSLLLIFLLSIVDCYGTLVSIYSRLIQAFIFFFGSFWVKLFLWYTEGDALLHDAKAAVSYHSAQVKRVFEITGCTLLLLL